MVYRRTRFCFIVPTPPSEEPTLLLVPKQSLHFLLKVLCHPIKARGILTQQKLNAFWAILSVNVSFILDIMASRV